MRIYLSFVLILLTACNAEPSAPTFHAQKNPSKLSEWNLLPLSNGELTLAKETLPYSLNTPLFTDYAHKLRTVWLPDGRIEYSEGTVLDFPIGTVITKTFYYPIGSNGALLKAADLQVVNHETGLDLRQHRLIETRLLVHRDGGWEPLSYVWSDSQDDAYLKRVGDIQALTITDGEGYKESFAYVVPNINQCAGCHAPNNTTRIMSPLGPKGANLDGDYAYSSGTQNQLEKMSAMGWLTSLPQERFAMALWLKPELSSLDQRARAYLDANCAHCHNPVGPADTSGLHLNYQNNSAPHLGICKNAVAAGSGTGGRKYDIHPGQPEDSITVFRMASTDPSAMMPELGRSLTHHEGVQVISNWIAEMRGECS